MRAGTSRDHRFLLEGSCEYRAGKELTHAARRQRGRGNTKTTGRMSETTTTESDPNAWESRELVETAGRSRATMGSDTRAGETHELAVSTGFGGDMTAREAQEQQISRYRLSHTDYEKILEYLEDEENFDFLYGSGRKTKVGGKVQSKATVYGIMAVHLAKTGLPLMTASVLQKKVERYIDMYKRARAMIVSTGGDVEKFEMTEGMTLEKKVNKVCPHYDRMHVLFGNRVKLEPSVLLLPVESPKNQAPNVDARLACDTGPTESRHNETESTNVDGHDGRFEASTLDDTTKNEAEATVAEVAAVQNLRSEDSRRMEQAVDDLQTPTSIPPSSRAERVRSDQLSKKQLLSPGKGAQYYVLQEAMKQKNAYKLAKIQSKERLKRQMLEDQRKQVRMELEEQRKKARIDRKATMMIELMKAGKSVEEVSAWLDCLTRVEDVDGS
ncbi:hypothetical protein R1sor_002665 [Riccia sorocarpa]|uniref:Uncharacterized protein n=1 Tax=Riccia sorocarpa TaxID=122646 RepID=A0ABD3GZT6_9MARC